MKKLLTIIWRKSVMNAYLPFTYYGLLMALFMPLFNNMWFPTNLAISIQQN